MINAPAGPDALSGLDLAALSLYGRCEHQGVICFILEKRDLGRIFQWGRIRTVGMCEKLAPKLTESRYNTLKLWNGKRDLRLLVPGALQRVDMSLNLIPENLLFPLLLSGIFLSQIFHVRPLIHLRMQEIF